MSMDVESHYKTNVLAHVRDSGGFDYGVNEQEMNRTHLRSRSDKFW